MDEDDGVNKEKLTRKSEKTVLFYAQKMINVQKIWSFCSKKSILLEKVLHF